MAKQQAIRELLAAARALNAWKVFPATDGNLSVRLSAATILITKRGLAKSSLTASSFVLQRLNREATSETSSEWYLHRDIYVARPDVNCVLHVHAPYLTAFAAVHRLPNRRLLSESVSALGEIVLVPYAEPGSEQMGRVVIHTSKSAALYLLSNHGVVAVGQTARAAQHSVERAEFLARIEFMSEALGGGHLIPEIADESAKR